MRKWRLILIGLFCLTTIGNGKEIPKDRLALEPLVFDSTAYKQFKSQKNLDYYKVKPQPEDNVIRKLINRLIRRLFNRSIDIPTKQADYIIIGISVFLFILIVAAFIFYKGSPFYINRKRKTAYEIEEEGIEGRNFEKLIQEALRQERFSDAVRWEYLRVLKRMNDEELISFDPTKTVNEYVSEITEKELKMLFRQLSAHFVYYRYGNGNATAGVYEEFKTQSEQLIRRLNEKK